MNFPRPPLHTLPGPAPAGGWVMPGVLASTLLAVVAVALASLVVWQQLAERRHTAEAEQFAYEASELTVRIEERFRGYRQVLRGGSALFAASREVEPHEWREYVSELRLEQDFPGIQGVGFSQWVPPDRLATHVQAMRARGHPDYRIWPEQARDAWSAIVMLEPLDWRNRRAIGFDMFAEPVRREAMARAVNVGGEALTGRVTLVQETQVDRQAGVLLYLPVFAPGEPTDSPEERWRALRGWVYSPFRMGDLMSGMLGRHRSEIRLRVFDEGDSQLLFDSYTAAAPPGPARHSEIRNLNLDGRVWRLVFDALPGYEEAARGEEATELLAVIMIGLLLVLATWSFANTRARAQELARASESLRRSEARYATLVNLAHEGIAATDAQFRLSFANPQLAETLGEVPEHLYGRAMDEFWAGGAPESRQRILARLERGLGSRYEVDLRRTDGEIITALVADAPLSDEHGQFKGAILMVTDISERKATERRIEHLATHDALTGVPNRLMLHDLLRQSLGLARRFGHRFALLFVDLDRFKAINDEHGHQAGDAVLVEAAHRMQGCLRSSDTLCRQGGDEFVVLLPEIEASHDAEVVAEKIRAALAEPFAVDGLLLRISSSIGLAVFPDHGMDEDSLLRSADDAMYLAKAAGRNCSRSPALK